MTPQHNDQLHRYADQVGLTAAGTVDAAWRELWRTLQPGPLAAAANYQRALQLLSGMPERMHRALWAGMGGLLHWAHGEAGRELVRRVPAAALQQLAVQRMPAAALLEDEAAIPVIVERRQSRRVKTAIGATPPARVPSERLQQLLFPPLPAEQVHDFLASILPGGDWTTIGDTASAATPNLLASIIASRTAAGESMRDVAQALLPYFDGSRVRATRAARTFGSYVGTRANLEAGEQIAELVTGYQVFDPGGPSARRDHMRRSGTRYMRRPGAGEWGMDVMPQPPLDRGGPFEEKQGLAWNCRCWLAPIIAGME